MYKYGNKFDNINSFLESSLCLSEEDIYKVRQLSENDKNAISIATFKQVYESVKNKSMTAKIDVIEHTQGDITKLQGYDDLQSSIGFLVSMQGRTKNPPKEIAQLRDCLENISRNTTYFKLGFQKDNDIVKMLYNSVVFSLVAGTAFLIAVTIDYSKSNMGDYQLAFKNSLHTMQQHRLFYDNIFKFNSMCHNGQLKEFFDASYNTDKFVGIGAVGMIGGGVAILLLGLWFIRELVYGIYYWRNTLSNELQLLAQFVELNSARLDTKDMRGVKVKQEEMVKKILHLSDVISVQEKVNETKAENDLKKDDGQINNNIDLSSDDNLL